MPEVPGRRAVNDIPPFLDRGGKLPLRDIEIGQRHRKDLGDLRALAASIESVGLLHPIVVTPDKRMVAGMRRYAACQALGWGEIPVTVVDLKSIVLGEFAENEMRKDFIISERVAIAEAVERELSGRQGSNQHVEKIPQAPRGERTRTVAAQKAGFGNDRTYRQAREVIEAAHADSALESIREEMDATGNVGGAYKKLRRARQATVPQPDLPKDKYRVIYADPPWSFDVWSGEGKDRAAENHYPTMTQAEIEALPVGDMAAEDCALFMWACWPQLPEALAVIKAWGFTYKTCGFLWVKTTKQGNPATGMGYWTRANSEPCLFATKGKPERVNADVPQVILSPRREHSQKPDEAAERIQRLIAGPYIEMFARQPRSGWAAWGNQI